MKIYKKIIYTHIVYLYSLSNPMKKSRFIINVWDLLISAWKRDEISFENEQIQEITNLTKDGISGTIVIQSYDQNSLLVTLHDLSCTLHEPCDKCTELYDRDVFIPEYSAKFQIEIDPEYEWDDEIFEIDKNENIDVKDMIINAITLQEPFTKKCPKCMDTDDDITEDDDVGTFEGTWNINFR